jgi:hypothetical protein
VSRPGRALFLESARAATRGGKGLGNIRPSRVSRPGRALFLDSVHSAVASAGGPKTVLRQLNRAPPAEATFFSHNFLALIFQ